MTACGCVTCRTPRSACVVSARCPSCLCVSFLRTGRCARSHRTGDCQHAFPMGETSVRSPPHDRTHTPPTSVRAGPGSRATCSPPVCLGTKAASARCVNPCLADFLSKGLTNARIGGGDSRSLAGRISPEARLTRLLRCDFHDLLKTPRLKTQTCLASRRG